MYFLDLTISIDGNGIISIKTHQKPMNLFLYIPPHSAQPPDLMKSLVFGLLNTYYLQNTFSGDVYTMVRHIFKRLLNRGHKVEDLRDFFLNTVHKIEDRNNHTVNTTRKRPNNNSLLENSIYFHIPFHPRVILRKNIRGIYEVICEVEPNDLGNFKSCINGESGETMKIDILTVASHRPKNIRDLLCPSTLADSDSCNVSRYV